MIFDLMLEVFNPESNFWEYYMNVQDEFILKLFNLLW